MRPERKMKMQEMRDRLSKELKTQMKDCQLNTHLSGVIFPLLRERMQSRGVRSFFVHTLAEYVESLAVSEKIRLKRTSNNLLFSTQLPFLAEGIIAVQYYENQILDGKGGLFSDGAYQMDKIHNNVIGGHFVKDFLYRYIAQNMFPEDCAGYRLTMEKVTRIFQLVDLGQAFQDKWGTFESFKSSKKNISISHQSDRFVKKELINEYWKIIKEQGVSEKSRYFTVNYLRRIALTSGALFELMAELVMDLLNYHGKERSSILEFSMRLGMTGQIVNDINDFVPTECGQATVSKTPEDAFADLRNNNVTLPLIFYFDANSRATWNELEMLRKNNPEMLLKKLSKSILKAQSVAFGSAEINYLDSDLPRLEASDMRAKVSKFLRVLSYEICSCFALLKKWISPNDKSTQAASTKTILSQNEALLNDLNSIVDEVANRFYRCLQPYLRSKEIA
ncbi:MAG: polyprenyl synthetase family protein [Saprospiraceae bacterium]|nr:polyprenyl synthetase family protein [Saprospiraceae bacterium]